eukprot:TRINITY_DN9829_c0_g1_i1.p1 TRINITY_DN9829_c0_g1~~TRINITY_DN9829_c0_g1_i1.p1  ORF type:complete len:176 (+),score=49.31 TRINITY_DN9829_c0_g1_i1:76-528(+)
MAVAIVGKHDVPLYVSTYGGLTEDEELWLQCTLVSCLDAVEERVRTVISVLPSEPRPNISPENRFLGFVMPAGEHRVYAATTNTMVKVICITRGSPREDRVNELLGKLLDLYSAQACNPFYEFESRITSPGFRADVDRHVEKCGTAPVRV